MPAAQIHHLPPIALQLVLPRGYPESEVPGCQLEAAWLSGAQRALLQHELQTLWEEQAGSPILYTWIDWLQQGALQHLGITDSLRILSGSLTSTSQPATPAQAAAANGGPHSPLSDSPPCQLGSQGSRQAEQTLVRLLQYDAARRAEAFQQGLHTCSICFEERPGGVRVCAGAAAVPGSAPSAAAELLQS